MIKKLCNYFKRIGVDYEVDTDRKAMSFDVETPQGWWHCSILVDYHSETKGGIGFYSTLPQRVPKLLHQQMAMFLMCLNNDRLFGGFEIDQGTGSVHFKTYIDFENRPFSEKAVERNMLINISIMQQHMPKIIRMINGAVALSGA